MKKLSLDALKAKTNHAVSADVMDKITGGNKEYCHGNGTVNEDVMKLLIH